MARIPLWLATAAFLMAVPTEGAVAMPSQTETVRALKHYLASDDPQLKTLLEYESLYICAKGEKTGVHESAVPAAPPASFARIEAINAASDEKILEDWEGVFDGAAAFSKAEIGDFDQLKKRIETQKYCDRFFQRVSDKHAYRRCQFRYIATERLFAEDKALCTRDAEALVKKEDKRPVQIYSCMRLKGWKNPESWIDNMELPATGKEGGRKEE
jgi:hypothetical protein